MNCKRHIALERIDIAELDAICKVENKPIIIYGSGYYGTQAAQHLILNGIKIKCFADNNSDYWEDTPFFVPCVSPAQMIAERNGEKVLVTPYNNYPEIEKYLINLGLPKEAIIRLPFVLREFDLVLPNSEQHTPSLEIEYAKEESTDPQITVVTIAWNTPEKYLRRAIESILGQTYRDFCYLIINHASDEPTSNILKEYADIDSRVKIIRFDKNYEVERQRGNIDLSKQIKKEMFDIFKSSINTPYVSMMDSDDYYAENRLERTLSEIKIGNYDAVFIQGIAYTEPDDNSMSIPVLPLLNIHTTDINGETELEKQKALCETVYNTAMWDLLLSTNYYLMALEQILVKQESTIGDDIFLSFIREKSRKIKYFQEILTYYTVRKGSVYVNSSKRELDKLILRYEWLCGRFEVFGPTLSSSYKYSIATYIIEMIRSNLSGWMKSGSKEQIRRYSQRLLLILNNSSLQEYVASRKTFLTVFDEFKHQITELSNQHFLNIAVFGLGFVGLTTALAFADKGHHVNAFDIDKLRRELISDRKIPFLEPMLGEILKERLGDTFSVCDSAEDCAATADVIFICVGTPAQPDGSAKLIHVYSVIGSILPLLKKNGVIVVKSTIPPGTTENSITTYIREKGYTNSVAVNPEFLREGHSWDDFVNADRIVCGVTDDHAKEVLTEVYRPFESPLHFVSPNTAEFIKYLSNTLLSTLISFSNDTALAAEAIGGIDIGKAFKILHEDKRLAGAGINTYIYPGCGYGGYCLPKDTTAFVAMAGSKGYTPRLIESVDTVNSRMPKLTAKKIIAAMQNHSDAIGILGLSFKPGSDDVRDSPAAKIITELIKQGYRNICVYDPVANKEFKAKYGYDLHYCDSSSDVCEHCKTVALVTTWDEFRDVNKTYPNVNWIDCRYFLDRGAV